MTDEEMKERYAKLPKDVRERFEKTARKVGLDLPFLPVPTETDTGRKWPKLSEEQQEISLREFRKSKEVEKAIRTPLTNKVQ